MALIGLLLAGGAVAAYVALQSPPAPPPVVDAAPPPRDAAPIPDAAVVDAAPEPIKDAAPVIIKTSLRIVSTPAGATVYERGRRIGRTPLTVRRPKSAATLGLTLKLAEHGEKKVSATLNQDTTIQVKLEPVFEVLP